MIVGSASSSNPQGPHRPRLDDARGARSGAGAAAITSPAARSDESTATASSEFSDVAVLLDRLRSLPEVRADRLSQVGQKLVQGAYLTREAAEQTAAALVGSRTN